jgi:hypothetical protein
MILTKMPQLNWASLLIPAPLGQSPLQLLLGTLVKCWLGNNKTINWNAGIDFNYQEIPNMRVRLKGTDELGIESVYYESADFSVDTFAPRAEIILASLRTPIACDL